MTLIGVYYASEIGIEILEELQTRLSVRISMVEQLDETTNHVTTIKISERRLEIKCQEANIVGGCLNFPRPIGERDLGTKIT